MAIWNYSLFSTKNPNFVPKKRCLHQKYADNSICFRFYESYYRVLVMCQKLALKRYPIKSQLGRVVFALPHESNVHKKAHDL